MKKTITILSRQFCEGTEEKMNLTSQGTLRRLHNQWMLQYCETLGDQTVETTVTVNGTVAQIRRSGVWETCLHLEQDKRNTCLYRTPYGECPMGVYCKTVCADLSEQGGSILLRYTLDLGGTNATEHEIYITIQ